METLVELQRRFLTVDSSQMSEFRTRIDRFHENVSQELVENTFWLLINHNTQEFHDSQVFR